MAEMEDGTPLPTANGPTMNNDGNATMMLPNLRCALRYYRALAPDAVPVPSLSFSLSVCVWGGGTMSLFSRVGGGTIV